MCWIGRRSCSANPSPPKGGFNDQEEKACSQPRDPRSRTSCTDRTSDTRDRSAGRSAEKVFWTGAITTAGSWGHLGWSTRQKRRQTLSFRWRSMTRANGVAVALPFRAPGQPASVNRRADCNDLNGEFCLLGWVALIVVQALPSWRRVSQRESHWRPCEVAKALRETCSQTASAAWIPPTHCHSLALWGADRKSAGCAESYLHRRRRPNLLEGERPGLNRGRRSWAWANRLRRTPNSAIWLSRNTLRWRGATAASKICSEIPITTSIQLDRKTSQ